VPILNEYASRFSRAGLPIYVTRDWHPEETTHFKQWGGTWPPHCVAGTSGAAFHSDLKLPAQAIVVSKGTQPDEDAYSVFQAHDYNGLSFGDSLRQEGVEHVYIGGLATDYCVRASVQDAIALGLETTVLVDAVRGVELKAGDSERALVEMKEAGADSVTLESIDAELPPGD